jgi:hypothetical protein
LQHHLQANAQPVSLPSCKFLVKSRLFVCDVMDGPKSEALRRARI